MRVRAWMAGSGVLALVAGLGSAAHAAPVTPQPQSLQLLLLQRSHGFAGTQVVGRVGRQVGRPLRGARAAGLPTVTFQTLDRSGKPVTDAESKGVLLIPLNGAEWLGLAVDSNGQAKGSVPAGDYAVSMYVNSPTNVTLIYLPKLSVTGDTSAVLDARKAKRVKASFDRKGLGTPEIVAGLTQRLPNGVSNVGTIDGSELYVTPVAPGNGVTYQVQVNVASTDNRLSYNVGASSDGVPSDPTVRVATKKLAAVRTDYASEGGKGCAGTHRGIDWGDGMIILTYERAGALPVTRTEYFTPGLTWVRDEGVTTPDCSFKDVNVVNRTEMFPRAGSYTAEWNKAPYGPTGGFWDLTPGNSWFSVGMLGQQDADGSAAPYAGATGTSTLRDANGTVVATSDQPGFANTWPAPAPGKYQLTVDMTGSPSWSDLATKQHVVWNLDITGRTLIHLPTIRYRTPLDNDNRAHAGAMQTLTLIPQDLAATSAGRPPTLWVSTNDGKTWNPVTTRPHGSTWTATYRNPTSGFVSLRTDLGGAVDQTVLHAYQIH